MSYITFSNFQGHTTSGFKNFKSLKLQGIINYHLIYLYYKDQFPLKTKITLL